MDVERSGTVPAFGWIERNHEKRQKISGPRFKTGAPKQSWIVEFYSFKRLNFFCNISARIYIFIHLK
jgi:hypothetical protein